MADIVQSQFGRWSLKEQSGWGTAAAPAEADALEVEVFLPNLVQAAIQPAVMRASNHANPVVAGTKAGQVELTMRGPLHGWTTDTTPAGNPSETPEMLIFESGLGELAAGTGRASDLAGGSASAPEITTPEAGSGGHALLVPTNAGGSTFSVGWVKTISGTTVTLHSDLNATPNTGTTEVYGSIVAAMKSTTLAANGLTLEWLGVNDDDFSKIRFWDGAVASLSIRLDPQGQPTWEATLRFLNWTNDANGSAAAYAFADPQAPVAIGANGARMMLNNAAVNGSSFTLNVATELVPINNMASDQGVSRYAASTRDATCEVTLEDAAWENGDDFFTPGQTVSATAGLQIDLSANSPGRAHSILIPNPIPLGHTAITDSGGVLAVVHRFGCGYFDGDTDSTTPADTALRVAWL